MLFDLPARKFHIFGLTLWPQDFFFLTWLLVIAALSLFFFTALAGRLWCGYACPQTVWTEAFLWMERLVEGSRTQQMKLAKAPWTAGKLLRKGAKQLLWIVFALWTGFTFVGYFTPIHELAGTVARSRLGPWETFWVLFYGGATYGNAGFMREQVCKYMCPYARFQSAMFDRDTLIITYDETRGEPRGARKKGVDPQGEGPRRLRRLHAVRAGLPDRHRHPQGPAVRVHRLRGLHRRLRRGHGQGRLPARPDPLRHAARPRGQARSTCCGRARSSTALLLALLVAGFGYALTHRNVVGVDVMRDRNALYRERPDEPIENVYNVKILNKDGDGARVPHHRERPARPRGRLRAARPSGSARDRCRACRCASAYREGTLEGGADIQVAIEATDQPGPAARAARRVSSHPPTDTLCNHERPARPDPGTGSSGPGC